MKLDTDKQVFFYEQEFYVLSNFSAFNLKWKGITFPTSEHAYHWEKFNDPGTKRWIIEAPSAHEAFKIAERNKQFRRFNWDDIKISIMKEILLAKVSQHEYVKRKLLETGSRELVEDSWRDAEWGWGPNKDGKNLLGKLWMEIRAELQESTNKLRSLADLISAGGKSAIFGMDKKERQDFAKQLEIHFRAKPFKVCHNSDTWEYTGENWRLNTLYPSEKICGYRFDNMIVLNDVPQEILQTVVAPMLSVRGPGKPGFLLFWKTL